MFDGKAASALFAMAGTAIWIAGCSIGPIYASLGARATLMAAIRVVYTLLVALELWRGRGDEVWRWPIIIVLLIHVAAIPTRIPLAGAWKHPDPADLDLLTFAIFESAFVCICTAYLFGGLAKDRIAADYRRASLTDPLTGVANRRGFFQRGERILTRARFGREPIALIMFDLDQFKNINDKFGHPAGDEILVVFCRLVSKRLRPNDLFGRIGGEEFVSLLPNTTPKKALLLAERVRTAIGSSAHAVGEDIVCITVSSGIAVLNEATDGLTGLLAAADQALHRAKATGRNRVEISFHAGIGPQRSLRLPAGLTLL
jgi:diguanylate cyclase (GGDEF)-like protein